MITIETKDRTFMLCNDNEAEIKALLFKLYKPSKRVTIKENGIILERCKLSDIFNKVK